MTDRCVRFSHHPGLRLVRFKGAGHFPMLTDPERFAPLLGELIGRILEDETGAGPRPLGRAGDARGWRRSRETLDLVSGLAAAQVPDAAHHGAACGWCPLRRGLARWARHGVDQLKGRGGGLPDDPVQQSSPGPRVTGGGRFCRMDPKSALECYKML